MKSFRCTFLSLFLGLVFISLSYGQAKVDSTFLDYISEGWNAAKESKYNDSVQNKYAYDYFLYYKEHRSTEVGIKAMESALTMWGNTGNADMMDKAIVFFEPDSELWSRAAHSLGNAYARDSSRTIQEGVNKLSDLKDKITNPEGKSAILTSLIRYNKRVVKDEEKVRTLAQELVNLDAGEWYVDFGLGAIYELESLSVGQPAPIFTATSYQGDEVNLSDHTGKYVILDFWATWCGPCKPEIPVIKSLTKTYPDNNLTVISIALEEETEKFRSFLTDNKIDWTQVIQPERWEDEIPTLYNVGGIPQKYIIGPDGNIVAKNLRGKKLVAKMDTLINGQ